MKHRMFFIHITRTGGTSFANILNEVYGDEAGTHKFLTKFTRKMTEQKKQDILNSRLILAGHCNFGIHELYKQDTYSYISLVRHPFEKYISHYHFRRRVAGNRLPDRWCVKYNIKEVAKKGAWTNCMTRHLAGGKEGKCAYDVRDPNMLQVAMENISTFFPFIGLTEEYETSVKILKKMFDWKMMPSIPVLNASGSTMTAADLDEETIDILTDILSMDLQLYYWIKDRYEKKKKEVLGE